MAKDTEWFWANYDLDWNREHQYAKDTMQSISSGVCNKCDYEGKTIGSECTCGDVHTWCDVCWGYWPDHEAAKRYEMEF